MENVGIAFVILHYNVYKETVNCVNSIKNNIDIDNYHIVIVDNCSPNKSGDCLKKNYQEDVKVTVIISPENLGFANGNNLGIDYVRHNYQSKYICCMNNDTLLEQSDFFTTLESEFSKNKAAVIGPKIRLLDGSLQLFKVKLQSSSYYSDQLKQLMKINDDQSWNQWQEETSHIKNYLKKYRRLYMYIKKIKSFVKINDWLYTRVHHKNVVLQGSCLIFTPVFFEKLNGFNTRTFMYYEELLLFLNLKKAGLSTEYCPNLCIKHLEYAATDSMYNSSVEKKKFVINNYIASIGVLVDELESYNKME